MHPTAEHGGVTARVGVLAPYFEQYSAYGGADPRSTPRGGGARGAARSGGRGARSAAPARSLGSRFSSVWGSITSSIAASLDAAADALSPRLSPFSLSPEPEALRQLKIPEEYLDPITQTLMLNPVTLPSSGAVMDMKTVANHKP